LIILIQFIIKSQLLIISTNGQGYEIIKNNEFNFKKFLQIKTDSKLLSRLLKGPQFAHWNNAEIGSHLMFKRNPNIYERGLFYCLNFFHN